jgi:hypothetical protein
MTSFGKYFDDQHESIVKAMQNKNKQQNVEWMEDYEKRQRDKKEKMYNKELMECSEKGVEISEECKVYFRGQFEKETSR